MPATRGRHRGSGGPAGSVAAACVAALAALTLASSCTSPSPTGEPDPAASSTAVTAADRSPTSSAHTAGTAPRDAERNPTLGIGTDASFPELGSAAYDVASYDLDLDYDPDTNDLDARARIEASANESIDEIRLDLDGLRVSKVTVGEDDAAFAVEDRKLVIEAPETIERGARFRVEVEYGGRPKPRSSEGVFGVEVGWHGGGGGSFVVSEPEGASTWFPVNNHPRDKATYTFAVTVPEPYSAIANGRLESTDDHGDSRTFHWVMDRPMANYLASVVTGEYREVKRGESDGVTYSDWVPEGFAASDTLTGKDAVQKLSAKLGPFPFSTYGSVVYPSQFVQGQRPETRDFLTGVALEVQGRSLYSENAGGSITVLHETAHQWMGDNVSLSDWSKDIWWVEGFAHFAQTAFEGSSRAGWERVREECRGQTPGALDISELFGEGSYVCGSLVFYALQQRVGDDTFWKILRTFNERFAYSNATTDDLVATAGDVAGEDLKGFFDDWLFGPLPELPG
jgi:aminopeptidase N